MRSYTSISDLPNIPALYVLYGGKGRGRYVAYVGLSSRLRDRITQHFIRRDSSIVTGVSAAMLNPDHVTEMRWWTSDRFEEKSVLEAAEYVAFDIFDPALRSRGRITQRARQLLEDDSFVQEIHALFRKEASGRHLFPSLDEVIDRVSALEEKVAELEKQLVNRH